MHDHLIHCLENDKFAMFPCCMSSERVLEVELLCECHMPELSESYFGFPTGDMIECTYCKEWYHDCCRKIPKKYFTDEALDYFCSKVCQIDSDKSMSLSY